LIDAMGRTVLSDPWAVGGEQLVLDAAALPVGSYAVRCQAQDGTVISTTSLVISR
jgi:hypothetical protein